MQGSRTKCAQRTKLTEREKSLSKAKRIIGVLAAVAVLAVPGAALASNPHGPNHGQVNAWCNVYKSKEHVSKFLDYALTYWDAARDAANNDNPALAAAFYGHAKYWLNLHIAYVQICN
jgi:hypothetical protein